MNQDVLKGKWLQLKGEVRTQWGKLTNDDWDVVAGRRDQFAGKVQERYGLAKDEAETRIAQWERKATDSWFVKDKTPPQ
jgi:uncharacterized protein YjbJ (UPF0337 family)